YKLHAGHAFGALPTAYRNQPHLTRTPRVRPAARRPIKVSNFNNADTIGVEILLAERQLRCLLGGHSVQTHRTVLEDHRIGQRFRLPNGGSKFIWRPIEREVNLGHLVKDAEASRLGSKELKEGLGEDMLPRVLVQHAP